MRLELGLGSGGVGRRYTEERVEGRGDSSSSFNERTFCFGAKFAAELLLNLGLRIVPTLDWD